MNIRFNDLQRKAVSAAAAVAISAVFIGAAVGPAINAPNASVYAQANVERASA